MMQDILTAPFITETAHICSVMFAHGWDERNSGNVSLLLDEAELTPYRDLSRVQRRIGLGFALPALAGKYFLVTGAGKYFKNVVRDPAASLAVLRLSADGSEAELLWGLSDGGSVTSEFAAHMMSHAARLSVDPAQRVVMHCHPTNLLAMTYVHDLDERAFTRTLWRMCTECVFVFPDGVNVLPWMVCGTEAIGVATAEKMKTARLCVWAMHGIYAVGESLDGAFGLIETAEKAAEVYLKIAHLPMKQCLTDDQLGQLARRFQVQTRPGWLEESAED